MTKKQVPKSWKKKVRIPVAKKPTSIETPKTVYNRRKKHKKKGSD